MNEVCQNDKINVVILGNKIDLLDEKQLRAVQKSLEESLEGLRQKYPQYMIGDIKYVSAKNNTKEEISCIVQETTEIIYARHNTGEKDESSSVIVLPKPKKKKKKCC